MTILTNLDRYLLWFSLHLLFTVCIEAAIAAICFRNRAVVSTTLLCNLLTNPVLNLLLIICLKAVGIQFYWPVVLFLEIITVFTEAAILKLLTCCTARQTVWMSLLLNGSSFLIGNFCTVFVENF